MCKKILLLLNIFAFLGLFTSPHIYAQNFKEIDLERLINKHPMMKNFDPLTRRFKGTASEFQSVASLTEKMRKNTTDQKMLKEEKKRIVSASLSAISENAAPWSRIASIDVKLNALDIKKRSIANALSLKGKTDVKTVLPVIQKMLSEILYKKKSNNNAVLLNKLPRYNPPTINYCENGLKDFFQSDDRAALIKYTQYTCYIGNLFKSIDKTIIFSREELQK